MVVRWIIFLTQLHHALEAGFGLDAVFPGHFGGEIHRGHQHQSGDGGEGQGEKSGDSSRQHQAPDKFYQDHPFIAADGISLF